MVVAEKKKKGKEKCRKQGCLVGRRVTLEWLAFWRHSRCSPMGSVVPWERWDTGLIPAPAQWVVDLALPQLQLGLQLRLRSDPWPRNSMCCGAVKKKKKKKKKRRRQMVGFLCGRMAPVRWRSDGEPFRAERRSCLDGRLSFPHAAAIVWVPGLRILGVEPDLDELPLQWNGKPGPWLVLVRFPGLCAFDPAPPQHCLRRCSEALDLQS